MSSAGIATHGKMMRNYHETYTYGERKSSSSVSEKSRAEFPEQSRMSQVFGCTLFVRENDVLLAKVRTASAIPSMKDEGSRQTRSFVIYWSLHFDVTEILDKFLRQTSDDDNGAVLFRALISPYTDIRRCPVFSFKHYVTIIMLGNEKFNWKICVKSQILMDSLGWLIFSPQISTWIIMRCLRALRGNQH